MNEMIEKEEKACGDIQDDNIEEKGEKDGDSPDSKE
jgi:hypothetical protein